MERCTSKVPDEKREFNWSIVCLHFITTNLKYILLEVCQTKNIKIASFLNDV